MDFKRAIRAFGFAALCTLGTFRAEAQTASPNIRINQIGFYPEAYKTAAVVSAPSATSFFVATTNLADTVFKGSLGDPKEWASSGETGIRLADFTALATPGRYVLGVPGIGVSHPFSIARNPNLELTKASIKAFYYNRASTNLLAEHAGKWARAGGHPDNRVYIHSSAVSPGRAAESQISSPRGWYDAGDYNKYVVNSGISTYTLLSLYRSFPAFFDTLKLNIPESGNAIPDLLDEVLWNLRWMMTMQDPGDGGVYHKLTSPNFSGSVMPNADLAKRYVVQKSVTAALDLAGTAAYASRLFRNFNGPMPGFADSALTVARKAWDWARANPTAYYRQTNMNTLHAPAIVTGEYGDGNATDEFFWAGAELYLATKEDSFFVAVTPNGRLPATFGVPGWSNVSTLGLYSLAEEMGGGGFSKIDPDSVKHRLNAAAAAIRGRIATSPYAITMGNNDFNWGSNSNSGNQGMLLIQAFRATGDSSFLKTAVHSLDYLLGRNATGFSFVTGHGSKSPMNPHHRPSEADGIAEPVPGFLVGGPNSGRQDNCTYPSTLPALSYSDTECSYASNEVTINWNAPLAYLAGALEAIYGTGATAVSLRSRILPGLAEAVIGWEGKTPRVHLPKGWKGELEVFDMKGGRVTLAAMDSAGSLWIYRLKATDGKGRKVTRTGTLSPLATLRVNLGG